MSYQSVKELEVVFVFNLDNCRPLREKGSTTFFLTPFLPFDRRLFCRLRVRMDLDNGEKEENHTFPTAILEELQNSKSQTSGLKPKLPTVKDIRTHCHM